MTTGHIEGLRCLIGNSQLAVKSIKCEQTTLGSELLIKEAPLPTAMDKAATYAFRTDSLSELGASARASSARSAALPLSAARPRDVF